MFFGTVPSFGRVKRGVTTITDDTAQELIGAPEPGNRWWLMGYTVSNPDGTTSTEVTFRSGTTGIWTVPGPSDSGAQGSLFHPIPLEVNEALNVIAADDLSGVLKVSWIVLEAPA